MSSALGGSIDWNNLNNASLQELKAVCHEKNLHLEGKPVKARYIEVLTKYRDDVLANETPKRKRGRPRKSSETTPAQSPAPKKSPKKTPKGTPASTPNKATNSSTEVQRLQSPPITQRSPSPLIQPIQTTKESTFYKSPVFIISIIFVLLAVVITLFN